MAGTGKKWLIGCGVGCAAMTLLMILITVGGGILMMRPFDRAIDFQKELDAEHGLREDFVPLPDGLTPQRIKAFLTVRAEMAHHCETFEEIASSFQQMEELDQGGEDPPIGEVLKGIGSVMGSVFSVAGEIGALHQTRNNELLKNGMGLGEYTWIYVLAYNSWLGYEPNTGFEGDQDGGFSEQEASLIRQLMRNHARALEEIGRHQEAEIWRAEAERLKRTLDRVPFASGGLPGEITSALIPYRAKIESSYCAAMSEFDLGRINKKGFSIQAE